MSLKILAVLGSPRKGGNTELLLEAALAHALRIGVQTTLFRLSDLNIRPCQNCGGCSKTGRCVIQDDDMSLVYEEIRDNDRILLASPIYFFSVSAQTKIMIDRCQAFWSEKYLLKKPLRPGPAGRKALLLLVGAYKNSRTGLECAETCAVSFFHSINVSEHRTVGVLGPDALGAIREYGAKLDEAAAAGRWLAS